VRISVDDREIDAFEGEPIVAALLASGILIARTSVETASPRGYFCGVGRCGDCQMIVDGMPNVRTCVTPVSDGQVIETQHAAGQWRARS
jgi:predicted molibdopterin-dependent oxidoreductase YjgC